MEYRAELDGLRALAVVPVLLYHAGFSGFGGGFVGVDVFFVISGYLITALIYPEIQAGKFSIVHFYERRARRLLPALAFVVFCCVPFAWMWMLPGELRAFANSIVAVNLFASNLLFLSESGYFEMSAELKPLLHTWSLAVEEQFYLLFPLLLLLLKRFQRGFNLLIVLMLALGSLIMASVLSTRQPDVNFFALHTRAWELAVGVMLALWMHRSPRIGKARNTQDSGQHGCRSGVSPSGAYTLSPVIAQCGALCGFTMVIGSIFTFDQSVPFPGPWALVPVIGAALIILCATTGTWVARLLQWRPVVGIGLISYSAYLWHQPLFAFARLRSPGELHGGAYLALIALTLLLATLSWRLVEAPFRNRLRFDRRRIFVLAGCAVFCMLAVGMTLREHHGFPARVGERGMAVLDAGRMMQGMPCSVDLDESFDPESVCLHGEEDRSLILWGDSHALALLPPLKEWAQRESRSLLQLTAQGCTPLLGYEWALQSLGCADKVQAMRNHLLEAAGPRDVVVVHGRWSNLLDPQAFDNQEGGAELDRVTEPQLLGSGEQLAVGESKWLEEMHRRFGSTMAPLLALDATIVLIYPVPEVGWHVPDYIGRQHLLGNEPVVAPSTSYQLFAERSAPAYAMLDSIGEHPNLLRIYPEQVVCNTASNGRCITEQQGQVLYFDDDHLSEAGASRVVALMDRRHAQYQDAREPAPQVPGDSLSSDAYTAFLGFP